MKLSIVATLYQSAPYIAEFFRRASAAARQIADDDYEIVLVNDGSPDESLDVAIGLTESDDHLVVVDLSRNFGHHRAMMTGLAHTRGAKVFLLDIDLEEEPEWLLDFAGQMSSSGCDAVYGVQESRRGGVFERWSGHWFYRVFNLLTGMAMPMNPVTARLMTRRYVDALLLHEEREVYITGLCLITGFAQQPRPVRKLSTSETTYTLARKLSLMVNSVTSFSNTPLIGIFYIGLAISAIAFVYLLFLLLDRALDPRPLEGWTSVMVSVWILGGLITSSIGIVGIYLSKIFSEAKQRPYTIIRQIYASQNRDAASIDRPLQH
jgi:putative glycosyltransferase